MDTQAPASKQVRPYPWSGLPTLARETVGAMRDARRAVSAAMDPEKIGALLSEITGAPTDVRVTGVDIAAGDAAPFAGIVMALATLDDTVRAYVELDTAFARAIVGRALGRPVALGNPRTELAPELEGALWAIVLQVARRAHGTGSPLVPFGRGQWRFEPGDRRLRIHASITLDREAYAARATVELRKTMPPPAVDPVAQLSSLGPLPIALPLIMASSLVRASDAFALAEGDIWLPGNGWTARRDAARARLVGRAVLAAPSSARGLGVKLGEAGEIVVVGKETTLLDVETTMQSPNQDQTATSEVVLDAPLVMRVEVGAVTLSAAEWATLAPGDVIAVGRRVNDPVLLRIAGAEVARGELVDIEGELGVRIRERARST